MMKISPLTIMEREALSAPKKVEGQLKNNKHLWTEIAKNLKSNPPHYVMTIARGSSDHAATFAKYLFEVEMGIVTSSSAPSVQTIYKRSVATQSGIVIGISQSGASPDIYETQLAATNSGACTIALVNQINSKLAKNSKYIVPLHAGTETAVAATKSYLATLVALVHFVAIYNNDTILLNALERLPEVLAECENLNWNSCIDSLLRVNSTYVVGRGFGYPIAQEAALKLKETSSIHAEPFSSAEVLHGPFTLIKEMFPVLVFGQNDASLGGVLEMTKNMTMLGAKTIFACPKGQSISQSLLCNTRLEMPHSLHSILDPIITIQAFYYMAAKLAVEKGLNPDSPKNLNKVTQTR